MLVKLVDSGSFFSDDEQKVSVIDFDNTRGMLKKAADSQIQNYVSEIKPEIGKTYLHILALGASEYYSSNRNGDNFPEANLIACHKTFETSPAHIFRNHQNKRPEIAIGKVLLSIYNNRMKRVELICELYNDKAPDIVERISKNDWPSTSMACTTPNDTCSICGHKAKTRQEYCSHIRNDLGKMFPDGKKVMAINDAPLRFFDISIVVKPADVTSSVLQKLASAEESIIGSAEEAFNEGLLEEGITKQSTIQKLSEFIKEIDGGVVVDYSESANKLLEKVRDPDIKIIDSLVNFKTTEILNTMASLGMSPSLPFLSELMGRKHLGDSGIGIGQLAAAIVTHTGASNMKLPDDEEVTGLDSLAIASILLPYMEHSSLLPDQVEKRAYLQGTNVGYIGNGPSIEPSAYERFREKNLVEPTEHGNIVKTLDILLKVGASALAAKWYITRLVEQKMKEAELSRSYDAKIHLVKSANDLRVSCKLVRADMIKAIRNK